MSREDIAARPLFGGASMLDVTEEIVEKVDPLLAVGRQRWRDYCLSTFCARGVRRVPRQLGRPVWLQAQTTT